MEQDLFECRHSALVKVKMETEDQNALIQNAALITRVFLKLKPGQYENVFKQGETILRRQIEDFYKEYVTSSTTKLEIPDVEDYKNKYIKQALNLAKESEQKENNRYVNPISRTVESLDTDYKEGIVKRVETAILNKTNLPILHDLNEDWQTFYETKYKEKDKQKVEPEKIPPNQSWVDQPEPVTSDDEMRDLSKNLEIRQHLSTKPTNHPKPYDILKMLDYLRILRRFRILSQWKDGKRGEVAQYIPLHDGNNAELKHAFLQRMGDTAAIDRFVKCMRIEGLKSLKK